MSIRARLIMSALLLILISIIGGAVVLSNIRALQSNQAMITVKDRIFHDHRTALELIQSGQSRLYKHKAGYSRDIDVLIEEISLFEALLANIPHIYNKSLDAPYCNTCHDNVSAVVVEHNNLIQDLIARTKKYKESISILITTSDPKAQLVHHGNANALGEGLIEGISDMNFTAGLMVAELTERNETLTRKTMVTIMWAMTTIVFIAFGILAYILFSLNHLMSALLTGTDSIYRDDFSQRLPIEDRNDEFGILGSRFNLMAEHLQQRDIEIKEKARQVEDANVQLSDLNENLENRIRERTSELENTVLQLRQATSALEESKRRLEAANIDLLRANQAKSNFLSIVSHELKTPLSVMNGFLSLILDERYRNDPKNLREAVEISKRRGQQLARMIDELIDLSRLDAKAMVIHKRAVPLDKALQDAAEQLEQDIERKQIYLKMNNCNPAEPLYCDPDKFKQIITNLLSNAVKFSPEGATIEIGCEEREGDFLFFCRDKGIGLAKEEKERVFEKFYQVDSSATRRYGGAGLGLSIVKEIVTLHGGRVWVESEEGAGSTFFFTIPKKGLEDIVEEEPASTRPSIGEVP